jgi:hypothetical protein
MITAETQGLRRQDGVPNSMLQNGYLPKPTWMVVPLALKGHDGKKGHDREAKPCLLFHACIRRPVRDGMVSTEMESHTPCILKAIPSPLPSRCVSPAGE